MKRENCRLHAGMNSLKGNILFVDNFFHEYLSVDFFKKDMLFAHILYTNYTHNTFWHFFF
jgi:hypothetical protein